MGKAIPRLLLAACWTVTLWVCSGLSVLRSLDGDSYKPCPTGLCNCNYNELVTLNSFGVLTCEDVSKLEWGQGTNMIGCDQRVWSGVDVSIAKCKTESKSLAVWNYTKFDGIEGFLEENDDELQLKVDLSLNWTGLLLRAITMCNNSSSSNCTLIKFSGERLYPLPQQILVRASTSSSITPSTASPSPLTSIRNFTEGRSIEGAFSWLDTSSAITTATTAGLTLVATPTSSVFQHATTFASKVSQAGFSPDLSTSPITAPSITAPSETGSSGPTITLSATAVSISSFVSPSSAISISSLASLSVAATPSSTASPSTSLPSSKNVSPATLVVDSLGKLPSTATNAAGSSSSMFSLRTVIDSSKPSSSYATSSAIVTPPVVTTERQPNTTSKSNRESSGVTLAVIVGASAGGGVVVLALLVVAVIYCRRKRRRQPQTRVPKDYILYNYASTGPTAAPSQQASDAATTSTSTLPSYASYTGLNQKSNGPVAPSSLALPVFASYTNLNKKSNSSPLSPNVPPLPSYSSYSDLNQHKGSPVSASAMEWPNNAARKDTSSEIMANNYNSLPIPKLHQAKHATSEVLVNESASLTRPKSKPSEHATGNLVGVPALARERSSEMDAGLRKADEADQRQNVNPRSKSISKPMYEPPAPPAPPGKSQGAPESVAKEALALAIATVISKGVEAKQRRQRQMSTNNGANSPQDVESELASRPLPLLPNKPADGVKSSAISNKSQALPKSLEPTNPVIPKPPPLGLMPLQQTSSTKLQKQVVSTPNRRVDEPGPQQPVKPAYPQNKVITKQPDGQFEAKQQTKPANPGEQVVPSLLAISQQAKKQDAVRNLPVQVKPPTTEAKQPTKQDNDQTRMASNPPAVVQVPVTYNQFSDILPEKSLPRVKPKTKEGERDPSLRYIKNLGNQIPLVHKNQHTDQRFQRTSVATPSRPEATNATPGMADARAPGLDRAYDSGNDSQQQGTSRESVKPTRPPGPKLSHQASTTDELPPRPLPKAPIQKHIPPPKGAPAPKLSPKPTRHISIPQTTPNAEVLRQDAGNGLSSKQHSDERIPVNEKVPLTSQDSQALSKELLNGNTRRSSSGNIIRATNEISYAEPKEKSQSEPQRKLGQSSLSDTLKHTALWKQSLPKAPAPSVPPLPKARKALSQDDINGPMGSPVRAYDINVGDQQYGTPPEKPVPAQRKQRIQSENSHFY